MTRSRYAHAIIDMLQKRKWDNIDGEPFEIKFERKQLIAFILNEDNIFSVYSCSS